ncbi:hypothetical protein JR739_004370 [Escherichia coli]|uniref:hypothetical protein n=1 Tax=Escherichia coli TaxID=562 RepID=UPI000681C035|nr:hypothetical protein [Escherichia coli]EEW1923795.1 hypothetical protein [Escherichia coli]EFB5463931.1 hypothetical protein [Escherichia coli]EFB5489263.1 hypothetical protein [Escherichia coli]EFD9247034.1 hypothetical protein [Escherichia coli]EFD9671823.1 hypothetical protein [Escherichia coli]
MSDTSGTVFIWYPSNGNIGHASLQIGNIYRPDRYVSWWPEGTAKPFRKENARETWYYLGDSFQKGRHATLQTDINDEGEVAHVTYLLSSVFFCEQKMLMEWQRIESKANAHYMLLSKNCSHIVSRVLASGYKGNNKRLNILTRNWFITKPRDIANIMNSLRVKGEVEKLKSNNYPQRKDRMGYVFLGMR